jgi:hypothetical protein
MGSELFSARLCNEEGENVMSTGLSLLTVPAKIILRWTIEAGSG